MMKLAALCGLALVASATAASFTCGGIKYTDFGTGTVGTGFNRAAQLGGYLPQDLSHYSCISNNIGGAQFWLGLHDAANEGQFKYHQGPRDGQTVSPTNWCGGEPNNAGNEDYVVANWGGNHCWNDWTTSASARIVVAEGDAACQPGTYKVGESCPQCPAGRFSVTEDAAACTQCAAGKFQANQGSTTCQDCPSGKTSAAGSAQCQDLFNSPPADRHCRATGDPHYVSWSGRRFDFQGVGRYWLVNCPSIPFYVQSEHYRNPTWSRAAVHGALAAQVDDKVVEIRTHASGYTVKIDGVEWDGNGVVLGAGAHQAHLTGAGNQVSLQYKNGARIKVDARSARHRWYLNVYVSVVSETFNYQCEGMCGKLGFSDGPERTCNGQQYANINEFGSCNGVGDDEDLFEGPLDPSQTPSGTPPEPIDDPINNPECADALQACEAKNLGGAALEECVYDLCATGDEDFGDQEHFDPCPEDCNGHGSCDQGTCTCYPGWEGDFCGFRTPEQNCANGQPRADGFCECNAGWTGALCDQPVDCANLNNCNNQGQCVDDACSCDAGFSGADCSEAADCSDLQNCSGNGQCIANNQCQCDAGFVGGDCSELDCSDNNQCSGHGVCRDGGNEQGAGNFCECDAAWGGPRCDDFSPCVNPDGKWLETELAPVLDVEGTGFNTGVRDLFQISYDVNRKYYGVRSETGAAAVDQSIYVSEHDSATGQVPAACWNHYILEIEWGDLVPHCARSDETGFIVFTCKLTLTQFEDLDPIRGRNIVREIISEMPFTVKFPKQVAAHLHDISVFKPALVIAALTYQEVDVNVNDLDVDATLRLFTSVQWPFKLDPADFSFSLLPADMQNNVQMSLETDCPDHNAGDLTNAAGNNAFACNQVWLLKFSPDNGASALPCELDGNYQTTHKAICQPSYGQLTDCPLVQDDQNQVDPTVQIDFILDSENFCPVVVDEVDISAELTAYKDHDHTVPASNFILGQTIYFKAVTSSSKATIVETTVDDIMIEFTADGSMPSFYVDKVDTGIVEDLVVENSALAAVPATQAWFQWKLSGENDGPFNPPVDGQIDYNVWVTLDVKFKDVNLLEHTERVVLLAEREGNAPVAAQAAFAMEGDEDSTQSAGSAVSSLFAAAAGVCAVVMA